jgi:hypothetical protein
MVVSVMPHCCGLREISGLSSYSAHTRKMKTIDEHLSVMYWQVYHKNPDYPTARENWRYAIFTEAWRQDGAQYGYGEAFATYIREHGLGDVIETTGEHVNPNSGNVLKVWVWTIDHDAVRPLAESAYLHQQQLLEKAKKAPPTLHRLTPDQIVEAVRTTRTRVGEGSDAHQ